ncbi:MAG TPA: DUF58 domain-containing protein [Vicinamibacterales bacterium]|nr:DUF58 domain-containing protein [Vicinamibacterales bacterium]
MIPEQVMKELRYIEIFTGRKIRNQRVGAYQTPLRGAGFDFDEHQPYRPGDDVRRIDWNVTARMDAPFVRHTHAEREMNVMVAMDVSRSMALGSAAHSKRETLTYITGSILFSAIADQINTGFMAFGDRVLASTPPKRTRAAAWSMLEQCWSLSSSSKETLMLPAVRQLGSTLKRMSVIFIVSDFVTGDNVLESPELAQLAARHDVIAVVPEDRSETALPPGSGYVQLRDVESGRRVSVGLSRQTRARYAVAIRERRERLARAFYRVPMDHVFVPTDGSPVLSLLSLFARRKA